MENVRKHRDFKLVTRDKRRNQLGSEPNYHTTKYFSENLMATEMKKREVKMNKPIYDGIPRLKHFCMNFGMIILKQSVKAKQNYATWILKALLFILKLKIFMKTWFDTSDCDQDNKRPPSIGKNKKEIGLFKDELEGMITKEFLGLRAKTYA